MTVDLESLGYELLDDGPYFPAHSSSSGMFWYNEGDEQEEWVADAIRRANDRGVFSRELLMNIRDWQSLYHLSQWRSNLLRPVAAQISGEVLEVGAGMGAISRALGELGLPVTSLEASRRRAEACAERTRDLDNVRVVCDTIQNFGALHSFDTVVCVGVLEYSRVFGFSDDRDPVAQMLSRLVEYLKPGGRLVLAIENQLGLKYLAGFREDHTGRAMYGIEDRYDDDDGQIAAVTLGRLQLSEHLVASGLPEQQWYYPFPDYKLPSMVLAQDALTPDSPIDAQALLEIGAEGDRQLPATVNFDMGRAWGPVLRNGLAPDLANSFLVVASARELATPKALAWVFGANPQRPEFAKVAEFIAADGGSFVRRSPLVDGTARRVGAFERVFPGEPYVRWNNWGSQLRRILTKDGWKLSDLEAWFGEWHRAVLDAAGLPPDSSPEAELNASMFDALPRNLVMGQGAKRFIDLEVLYHDSLTVSDLAYRALQDVLEREWVAPPQSGTPLDRRVLAEILLRSIGVPFDEDRFESHKRLESSFAEAVVGVPVDLGRRFSGSIETKTVADGPWAPQTAQVVRDLEIARHRVGLFKAQRDGMLNELKALRQEVARLDQENRLLLSQVEELTAGAEALRQTTSWKVTKPLRAIRALVGSDDS